MATSAVSPPLSSISASVVQVEEKYLRLKSPSLGNNYIKISAIFARRSLVKPSKTETTTTKLCDEFMVGDEFLLDVFCDSGCYIPRQIHSIQLHRAEGTRLIADGILVDVSDMSMFVRSAFIPDFICEREQCVVPENGAKVGDVVTFEVLVTAHNVKCVYLVVHAPDTRGVSFPIYRTTGVVQQDPSTGNIGVRCRAVDGGEISIPLYDGAYFGCGVPVYALIGENIKCVVCPSQPLYSSSDLQVILFEPYAEGVIRREDTLPPAAVDFCRHSGSSTAGQSFHDLQCSRFFNADTLKMLRNSFLFLYDHSEPAKFEQLIHAYPKLVSIILAQLGIGDGAIYEPHGDGAARGSSSSTVDNHSRDGSQQQAMFQQPEEENVKESRGDYEARDRRSGEPLVEAAGNTQQSNSNTAVGRGGDRVPMPPNFHPSDVFGIEMVGNDRKNTNDEQLNRIESLPSAPPINRDQQKSRITAIRDQLHNRLTGDNQNQSQNRMGLDTTGNYLQSRITAGIRDRLQNRAVVYNRNQPLNRIGLDIAGDQLRSGITAGNRDQMQNRINFGNRCAQPENQITVENRTQPESRAVLLENLATPSSRARMSAAAALFADNGDGAVFGNQRRKHVGKVKPG